MILRNAFLNEAGSMQKFENIKFIKSDEEKRLNSRQVERVYHNSHLILLVYTEIFHPIDIIHRKYSRLGYLVCFEKLKVNTVKTLANEPQS